jgi:hypothetical protein
MLVLKESVERKKKAFETKCRIWRLKGAVLKTSFCENVHSWAMDRSKEEDVENLWKGLKDCLLVVADQVCRRTKDPARHRKTWW